MTLDAVMDYLDHGGQPLPAPVDTAGALTLVTSLDSVRMRFFAVVGEYMRFDDATRNALKDAVQNILLGLERPGHKRNTI